MGDYLWIHAVIRGIRLMFHQSKIFQIEAVNAFANFDKLELSSRWFVIGKKIKSEYFGECACLCKKANITLTLKILLWIIRGSCEILRPDMEMPNKDHHPNESKNNESIFSVPKKFEATIEAHCDL